MKNRLLRSGPEDDAASEQALLNISAPIARPRDQSTDGVWDRHVPAVEAFLEVATQFSVLLAPNGRKLLSGLDYSRARAGWELLGVKVSAEMFSQIQIIERAALDAFNRG